MSIVYMNNYCIVTRKIKEKIELVIYIDYPDI